MSPAVSLPSIHEGFPDVDFKNPPVSRSFPIVRALSREDLVEMSPHASTKHLYSSTITHLQQSYVSSSRKDNRLPVRGNVADDYFQNVPSSSPCSHLQTALRGKHLLSPSSADPTSFSLHRIDPSALGSVKSGQKPSFTGTHSFDVLRSDPSTFSLEHIASSKTLQSRSPNSTKPASPTGIANGSSPAFRVVLPTVLSDSVRADKTITHLDSTGNRPNSFLGAIDRQSIPSIQPVDSSGPTSFTFSDGTQVTKMSVDDEFISRYREVSGRGATFRVEGRGKKHQCPQCPKRFNRPSSLRIHVNTHTGARPFQCPYPNCGREFNVNSNMRRHYRNHGLAATAEVHPPRHNSGRRPSGYSRPHPGLTPTTVFRASSAQSPRTTLSAASFTDDDLDMEQISDDGEDSAFDDEDDEDDADDDENDETKTNRYSHIPPADYRYDHSYQYSPSFSLTRYSESSSAVPQRPGRIVYSPSSPAYVQSCKDTKVSTTLRPAFR